MKKRLPIKGTNHHFSKTTIKTIIDSKGSYDKYKCIYCKHEGVRYGTKDHLVVEDSVPEDCPKAPDKNPDIYVNRKLRMTTALSGTYYTNLTYGTEHKVVSPPFGEKKRNGDGGVYVIGGKNYPVFVYFGEFVWTLVRKTLKQ